ncbi:hypothetical protein BDR03DRAFT_947369 [Suillus americanus]|nr:hypothetical protein BDR03DRAFT_947369 [Suillus americanus]
MYKARRTWPWRIPYIGARVPLQSSSCPPLLTSSLLPSSDSLPRPLLLPLPRPLPVPRRAGGPPQRDGSPPPPPVASSLPVRQWLGAALKQLWYQLGS